MSSTVVLSSSYKPVIGVLALQGCVLPHKFHIEALGAQFKEIRTEEELNLVDGLILPGGESTTMLKLIHVFKLQNALQKFFAQKPVWGICAGSILMANTVTAPEQESFKLLDITVQRNAYGSQLQSFNTVINNSTVSFIRAPQIVKVGANVTTKAELNNQAVWVQKNFYMATTFHPELSTNTPSSLHQEFLKLVLLNQTSSPNSVN